MEYLHSLYVNIFGASEDAAAEPKKIVAFGNVLLDHTAQLNDTTLLDRFQLKPDSKGEVATSRLAEITAEACKELECAVNPGGSALNTVRILKHLGTDALFLGAVGEDENGNQLKQILQERGVETRLQTVSDVPTGQCICLVQENTTTLYANIGASAKFSADFLEATAMSILRPVERKQILYIEGFFIPQRQDVCEHIIKSYIRERRRLALNLSAVYIVKENFEQILHLVKHAYFIFGNKSEYQALMDLMGIDTLEALGEQLLENNTVKLIVVTKGEDGVHVITNYVGEHEDAGSIAHIIYNAPRVDNVVDTTGAGDAFVAGFMHAWMQKRSPSECVRIATDVAAKVVTQIGCNMPA